MCLHINGDLLMGRPKKLIEPVVEEATIDGVNLDDIEEIAEPIVKETVKVDLPETKDVFIFTNGDTGEHHVFDTKEEAEAFKVDKNGVIRSGIFNNKHNNIDVIRG